MPSLSIEIADLTWRPAGSDRLTLDLRGTSISLPAGGLLLVSGASGAGKSTLIRSIVGLQRVDTGIISVAGRAIKEISPRDRSRLIGYVPQDPGDLLYLTTVGEECARSDKDSGVESGETFALLQKMLPTIKAETHPRELSEGQRLTLVLAIVLIGRPQLLILDEPTRGLDYEAKANLMRTLHTLSRESDTAVLMATHDVEIVAEVADRTIFLAEGEKVADGLTLDVLLASPAFAPQVAKVMAPKRWLTVSDVLRSISGESA